METKNLIRIDLVQTPQGHLMSRGRSLSSVDGGYARPFGIATSRALQKCWGPTLVPVFALGDQGDANATSVIAATADVPTFPSASSGRRT